MKHVKPQSVVKRMPVRAQEVDPCAELTGKDLCKCQKEGEKGDKGSKKEPA